MDGGDVGNDGDLVRAHDVATHTRHAAIGLVVDEQPAPVVTAIGVTHVHMVRIAILPATLVTLAEDGEGFVGLSPAGGAVAVEYRDRRQLAHRRHAQYAYFATLPA
ncbi:hypothetical protein D9M73_261440 [compost metagenome]